MARSSPSTLDLARPFLDAIERLSPLIRSTAARAEERGRLDEQLIGELKGRRFFRLWLPHTYDGEEMALPASCLIYEAASYEDGATGWTIMIGAGGGLFGATLSPAAAREIFNDPGAVIAGSGNPSGTARESDDGYRVDGRWRYASGAYHATWFTANTTVHRDGQALHDEQGAPVIRAMAFPADAVEVIPAWDVSGMRATGSEDIAVRDRYVPGYRSFDVFGPRHEDGVLFRYPFMSLTELSVASVALGIARRGLDEWAAIAREKTPLFSTTPMAEQAFATIRFAEATIAHASARAFWWEQLAESWNTVVSGGALNDASMARVRVAAFHAASASARAIDVLRDAAGMSALFMDSDLGRCWRDVHAASQHVTVAPSVLEPSGRALLSD
jgi:indole-3-acetate monooxygenase